MVEARCFEFGLLALFAVDELAVDLFAQVLEDPDFVKWLLLVSFDDVAAINVLYPNFLSSSSLLDEEFFIASVVSGTFFAFLFATRLVLFLIVF